MIIITKYDIGDIVYLKTDPEQLPMIITGITIRENQVTSYHLSYGVEDSWHWDVEISKERNFEAIV